MKKKMKNIRIVDKYELKSVFPCSGLRVVYIEESEEQAGKYVLSSYPLHLMGMARVVSTTYEGGVHEKKIHEAIFDDFIVCLDLADGYFGIADEHENFIGIIREGEDPKKLSWLVNKGKFQLTPEFSSE